MDAADTDKEDVGDPIILTAYEQNRFGYYGSKEIASNKREEKSPSEEQNLINNKKYLNVSATTNVQSPNLKKHHEFCPVSIKLVDFVKYPWYYKFNQRVKSLENYTEINKNQEDPDPLSSESDVEDIICLNPICVKHKVMHTPNETHIPKYNESAKGSCLFNEEHFSKFSYVKQDRSNIANIHSGTNYCLDIDFKKNRGLIGMRIRRKISTDELMQGHDKLNNYKGLTNSINSRDLVLNKLPVKDVTTTKPVYNKNILNRTEHKEISSIYQANRPISSNGKLKKNCSPILKFKVDNKKAPNHPIKLTTNVSEIHDKDKTFFSDSLEMKKNHKYFKDSKLSKIEKKIDETEKSPILYSNIQSNKKLSSTPEARSMSPIFPCKNSIKTKISRILPRSEISTEFQGAINHEKNNLYCLKKKLTFEQDTALEKKQKQINRFIKNSNKNKILVSNKLNNIVENLYKRKLQQKANSISSEITNSEKKASVTKKFCKNSQDIEKVKTNMIFQTNHKENKIINNLSLNNTSHTKSSNTSELSSQLFSIHKFNCNFEQLPRYDKTSIPINFKWWYRKHFTSSLTSGPAVKYQIPHKHIRIPPVSSVLLNSTKFKETLPCTHIPNQTNLLHQKNKTEASKEYVTNSTTNIKCTSKETVIEHKPDNVSQNNVQRTEVTSDNEILNLTNESKGYSPPILPIPTYQTTFEYLDRFSIGELYTVGQNIEDFDNQTVFDSILPSSLCRNIWANSDYSECKDSFRKRKLNATDCGLKKNISLTEYKARIDELGYVPIGESLGNIPCNLDTNLSPGRCRCLKNTPNCCLESEDIGYDSDRTVLL